MKMGDLEVLHKSFIRKFKDMYKQEQNRLSEKLKQKVQEQQTETHSTEKLEEQNRLSGKLKHKIQEKQTETLSTEKLEEQNGLSEKLKQKIQEKQTETLSTEKLEEQNGLSEKLKQKIQEQQTETHSTEKLKEQNRLSGKLKHKIQEKQTETLSTEKLEEQNGLSEKLKQKVQEKQTETLSTEKLEEQNGLSEKLKQKVQEKQTETLSTEKLEEQNGLSKKLKQKIQEQQTETLSTEKLKEQNRLSEKLKHKIQEQQTETHSTENLKEQNRLSGKLKYKIQEKQTETHSTEAFKLELCCLFHTVNEYRIQLEDLKTQLYLSNFENDALKNEIMNLKDQLQSSNNKCDNQRKKSEDHSKKERLVDCYVEDEDLCEDMGKLSQKSVIYRGRTEDYTISDHENMVKKDLLHKIETLEASHSEEIYAAYLKFEEFKFDWIKRTEEIITSLYEKHDVELTELQNKLSAEHSRHLCKQTEEHFKEISEIKLRHSNGMMNMENCYKSQICDLEEQLLAEKSKSKALGRRLKMKEIEFSNGLELCHNKYSKKINMCECLNSRYKTNLRHSLAKNLRLKTEIDERYRVYEEDVYEKEELISLLKRKIEVLEEAAKNTNKFDDIDQGANIKSLEASNTSLVLGNKAFKESLSYTTYKYITNRSDFELNSNTEEENEDKNKEKSITLWQISSASPLVPGSMETPIVQLEPGPSGQDASKVEKSESDSSNIMEYKKLMSIEEIDEYL